METARRYVELIGAEKVLAEGRKAFEAGDYRWAAQLLHSLVFADPEHREARELQADAYEQLGHQAEGPQWRGIYLTAAKELREGVQPARFATASADTVLAMPVDILFDFAAVHLAGDRAATADLRIGFRITDLDETWTMWVRHGVLNARKGASGTAGLTVAGPRAGLAGVLLGQDVPGAAAEGDGRLLEEYRALLDAFDPDFPVVTP